MTETFYRTGNYEVDHTTFGGIIYASDFDRKPTLSDIASRIESDQKFNEKCRKNILNRKIYGGKKKCLEK